MNREYPAEVICQFTQNGKIIPLKIRMEEQEYREYRILSYQEKFRHLEYRQGFMTDYQIVSQVDYECRVQALEESLEGGKTGEQEWPQGRVHNLRLRYYIAEMRWTVTG